MIEVKALFLWAREMVIMIIGVTVGEVEGWWESVIWEKFREGEVYEFGGDEAMFCRQTITAKMKKDCEFINLLGFRDRLIEGYEEKVTILH